MTTPSRTALSRTVLSRTVAVSACAVALVLSGGPAWAGNPHQGGGGGGQGGGGGGGTSSTVTGIDVSYPQCGDSLPTDEAFAVVGVNGGLANDYNSCLAAQFSYAAASTGTTTQPVAQTYLNTADPGNGVADWPSPGQPGAYGTASTPYGTCDYANSGSSGPGADSTACAYVYGYDMVAGISAASEDIEGDAPYFSGVTGDALGQQPVWLDVETGNSWQTGAYGLEMNVAVLQGMVDAVRKTGSAPVGIYSTASQWGQITGTPTGTAAGNLAGLPVWIPGARKQSDAQANCSQTSFTGGAVTLTQWFGHPYDGDVSCAG